MYNMNQIVVCDRQHGFWLWCLATTYEKKKNRHLIWMAIFSGPIMLQTISLHFTNHLFFFFFFPNLAGPISNSIQKHGQRYIVIQFNIELM